MIVNIKPDGSIEYESITEEMIIRKYFWENVRWVTNENNEVEPVADWRIDPAEIVAFLKELRAYNNRPPISDG